MAMLKIKNEQGGWDEILAIRGRDGAIQYTAGANIEISPENVISAVGLEGTVTRSDVETMISAAVPTDVSDLTNDAGYITASAVPTNTSDLTNDSGYITSSSLPTKTSDLTNDSGYITAAQVPAEQEPAFNASVARNITQGDINNWNGKQAPIVFNTAYNSSTNKAATMSDMPYVPTKLSDLTNDSGYALRSELPTVPTKLSDLTNDTGFVTSSAIPTKTSDLTNDSNYATLSDIPTVPTKLSDLTNDTGYITSASVPTKVSDLTNDSGFVTNNALPTKVSDLTNDSGFITSSDIPPIPAYTSDLINDSDFITYNDLPTIPTKTSDLTNDSGFITSSSVPTKTSQLSNDSGFVTSSSVPDVTTELKYDSFSPLTYSGGSYSLNSVYYYLHKVLVKNNAIDDTQIGLFQIQSNETGFTAITGKSIFDFTHFFKNSNSDYQSAAYGTALIAGFEENDYDVLLSTDWRISSITNYSTYAEITFTRQYLFAYSTNIITANPNHFALKTDLKTIKFTKYTS